MDEIVAFAELERFIDLPVRTYSSGMYMRLGFSVAAHIQADVLLLDEVFAVGDEDFQRKCFGKIAEFKQRGGTIVFVSHDALAVERLCDRAVLLRHGLVAFDGPTRDAIARYRELLAEERSPDEVGAGLREWGSGEARIVAAQLLDADGDERVQAAAGERLVVRLVVASRAGRASADRLARAPRRRRRRARRGLAVDGRARLGRAGRPAGAPVRVRARSRSRRGASTSAPRSSRPTAGACSIRWTTRSAFSSCPTGPETGAVLLAGRWSMQELGASEPIARV